MDCVTLKLLTKVHRHTHQGCAVAVQPFDTESNLRLLTFICGGAVVLSKQTLPGTPRDAGLAHKHHQQPPPSCHTRLMLCSHCVVQAPKPVPEALKQGVESVADKGFSVAPGNQRLPRLSLVLCSPINCQVYVPVFRQSSLEHISMASLASLEHISILGILCHRSESCFLGVESSAGPLAPPRHALACSSACVPDS